MPPPPDALTTGRRRAAASAALLAALLGGCDAPSSSAARETPQSAPAAVETAAAARYVGGATCVGCHAREAALWRDSHHDQAMQIPDAASVLGDFDDAELTYGGITSTFFRRDGRYFVRTDGPDGIGEFEIAYTFGVEPLQQYLLALPGGRLQAFGIAWDSRPAAEGGERWFHLYPDAGVDAAHALHWTKPAQNWNAGCAECHSTNLSKNYLAARDVYETTWTDVDVNCEACHGPGSAHVADPTGARPALAAVARAWTFADGSSIATRVPAEPVRAELEVCAQCHARRSQNGEAFVPGAELFLDTFRPQLLERELYHADGQILDEVYVYGSFVQSAMHAAGVTCSDCHDPHSTKVRADGNALCAQCHLPARYDTFEHHRHQAASPGSQCVECHMPATTYMVVDPRRDHSFRVPRPDLSETLDTPNACNECHDDRPAGWAAAAIAEWFPEGRHAQPHYGEAIAAGRNWYAERAALLHEIVDDPATPGIVRATALQLIAEQMSERSLALIERQLSSEDPLVLLAAIDALGNAPPDAAAAAAQRFLSSPSRAVRSAAALASLPARERLSTRRQAELDAAIAEYRDAQLFNGDRAQGTFNEGAVAAALGRSAEAERAFRAAIDAEPAFVPAYVNLADLLRLQGRETDAEAQLRRGLEVAPDEALLHYSLGLSLVRSGRTAEAVEAFARAAALAPDVPRYAYTLGVALRSTNEPERGVEALRAAHERFPGHAATLIALATMLRDDGRLDEAADHARALVEVTLGDAGAVRLLREIEARR